jgi:hypothetical protein
MSKSLGNVVDPVEILKKYTADTVRFYMIRETYYGDDAPFNQEHMEDLHNSNLADAVSPRSSTPSNTIEYKLTPIEYKLTPIEYKLTPIEYKLTPIEYKLTPIKYKLTPPNTN